MDEPDAWWGHVPVFIETLGQVGDHEEWYRRQLRSALANIKAPTDLERIPDDGFYVRIVAGVKQPSELICGFILGEELDGYCSCASLAEMSIASRVIYHPTTDLGTNANPFVPLFGEFHDSVAFGWENYLEWRRCKRWKPVPEWLVKLRAEERKAQRRKRIDNFVGNAIPALIAGVAGSRPAGRGGASPKG